MLTPQPGSAVPDGTLPDFAPLPTDESVYVFRVVGTSRCDVRAACSGATPSNCQCRSVIRSARYYAGGDGAARRPYHRAKRIRIGGLISFALLGWRSFQILFHILHRSDQPASELCPY